MDAAPMLKVAGNSNLVLFVRTTFVRCCTQFSNPKSFAISNLLEISAL
jgi:hypothetical protein